jgi:hypothetical protein
MEVTNMQLQTGSIQTPKPSGQDMETYLGVGKISINLGETGAPPVDYCHAVITTAWDSLRAKSNPKEGYLCIFKKKNKKMKIKY